MVLDDENLEDYWIKHTMATEKLTEDEGCCMSMLLQLSEDEREEAMRMFKEEWYGRG